MLSLPEQPIDILQVIRKFDEAKSTLQRSRQYLRDIRQKFNHLVEVQEFLLANWALHPEKKGDECRRASSKSKWIDALPMVCWERDLEDESDSKADLKGPVLWTVVVATGLPGERGRRVSI